MSKQCGILNILQPYRPPLSVTGIALRCQEKLLNNKKEHVIYAIKEAVIKQNVQEG
jgi:hypothetical protein